MQKTSALANASLAGHAVADENELPSLSTADRRARAAWGRAAGAISEHESRRIYWQLVRRTVREVFGGRRPDLAEVDRIRIVPGEADPGTSDKFYQTDPYSVAADIMSAGVGTPDQQQRYVDIKIALKFGAQADSRA